VKVRLEDIPPEGLELSFSAAGQGPEAYGGQVIQVAEPPVAELFLERHGDMVTARGSYRARLVLACSRCLEPMAVELGGPLEMVYQPQPTALGHEEVELADDEMEVSFYGGEEIDLAGALFDEVNLAIPMAPLCRPECPGMCPRCGQSRQNGACTCSNEESDPRWAKLAELKLE